MVAAPSPSPWPGPPDGPPPTAEPNETPLAWDPLRAEKMVRHQLISRDIRAQRVLETMRRVPRSAFVPAGEDPYFDGPIPIGEGQTISQPYVVARMTELLDVAPGMSVLEIGVGSGYQTAILAAMGAEVFGIERHAALIEKARRSLTLAGLLDRVHLLVGDGTRGWPEPRSFDRILAAAGAPELPRKLLQSQLADGGRAVLPIGPMESQRIMVIDRRGDMFDTRALDAVRFVPLIGEEGWKGERMKDDEG